MSTGSLVFAVLDGEKLIRTSARSSGSTGSASANCDVTGSTIKTWATEISQYIKSIDSNHLVGLGDEGWFEEANPPSYPYAPSVGINFTSNLEVETLDFGTVHLYPEVSATAVLARCAGRLNVNAFPQSWGETDGAPAWGVQWIADHATAQKNANKPVILGENLAVMPHFCSTDPYHCD